MPLSRIYANSRCSVAFPALINASYVFSNVSSSGNPKRSEPKSLASREGDMPFLRLYDVVEDSREKRATTRAKDEDDRLSRKELNAEAGYLVSDD